MDVDKSTSRRGDSLGPLGGVGSSRWVGVEGGGEG